MSETHRPGLWPVPGDGVLARHGNLILLSSIESGQLVDALLDLLDEMVAAGGDGRHFADAVADALDADADTREATGGEGEAGPSVLAFGAAGAGLAVTVGGGAWAEVTTRHGAQRIEAGQPGMLLRCVLRSPVSGVRGGLGASGNGAARTDRFSRLDGGTVRASGLSYFVSLAGPTAETGAPPTPQEQAPPPRVVEGPPEAAEASPRVVEGPPPSAEPLPPIEEAPPPAARTELWPGQAQGGWPGEPAPAPIQQQDFPPPPDLPGAGPVPQAEPQAERQATIPPMPPEPFEAVLLFNAGAEPDVDMPEREPLSKVTDLPAGATSYVSDAPIIQGVYCKNGHFDDPQALFCAICGISMNQQTLVHRPGTRPPLGVLVLDDGSVFQLDADYVVGREPSLDSSVAAGTARALRVADDSGIVSRVHARVHLEAWRVLVTDLDSANGTRIKLPSQPADQPLVPQVPVVLATGSQVDLGGRGFRYESHRGR